MDTAEVLLERVNPGKLLLADRAAEGSLDNVKRRFEAAAADAAEDHHLELEDAVDHLDCTWSAAEQRRNSYLRKVEWRRTGEKASFLLWGGAGMALGEMSESVTENATAAAAVPSSMRKSVAS